MIRLSRIFVVAIALGLAAPNLARADALGAGTSAFNRGDYNSAGRLLLPGHQVAGRDPGPGQHRQGGGPQGLLEFGHDAASVRVAALRAGGAHQPSQPRLVLVVRSTWHRRLLVSRPSPR